MFKEMMFNLFVKL